MKMLFIIFAFAVFSCAQRTENNQNTLVDTVFYTVKKEKDFTYKEINQFTVFSPYRNADDHLVKVAIDFKQNPNVIWDKKLVTEATKAAFVYDETAHQIDINYQGEINLYGEEELLDFYLINFEYFNIKKEYRCLVNKKENTVYYFDYESHFLVKVDKNSDKVFFAGIEGRQLRYFELVATNGISYNILLSSRDICDSIIDDKNIIGIPVRWALEENSCLQIKNHKLDYQNIDLNNDGLLDIRFSGWRMQYCPEKHWDLASRTEQDTLIDSIPIIVDFIAYQNRAKQYRWRYVDRNCGMKLTTWD